MNQPEVVADWARPDPGPDGELLLPSGRRVAAPIFVNNLDWIGKLSVVGLLRDVGSTSGSRR